MCSFASDYGGYLTRDVLITDLRTEIRNPAGLLVNSIDDNSAVFYKVTRNIMIGEGAGAGAEGGGGGGGGGKEEEEEEKKYTFKGWTKRYEAERDKRREEDREKARRERDERGRGMEREHELDPLEAHRKALAKHEAEGRGGARREEAPLEAPVRRVRKGGERGSRPKKRDPRSGQATTSRREDEPPAYTKMREKAEKRFAREYKQRQTKKASQAKVAAAMAKEREVRGGYHPTGGGGGKKD